MTADLSSLPPLKDDEYDVTISTLHEPCLEATGKGEAAVLSNNLFRNKGDVIVAVNGFLTTQWPFSFLQNLITSIFNKSHSSYISLRLRDCKYVSPEEEERRMLTERLEEQSADVGMYTQVEASSKKEWERLSGLVEDYTEKVKKARNNLLELERTLQSYTLGSERYCSYYEHDSKEKRSAIRRWKATKKALADFDKALEKSSETTTPSDPDAAESTEPSEKNNNNKRRRVSLDPTDSPKRRKPHRSCRTAAKSVCPITREEMEKPVINLTCGHIYSEQGMKKLVQQYHGRGRKCPCPIAGCSNPDLQPNDCGEHIG